MSPLPIKKSTAQCFTIPGFSGRVGIIASNSRSFCHECNRIRVTAVGKVKTCLYGSNELDLRAMLRNGYRDEEIRTAILGFAQDRFRDGFEAHLKRKNESSETMAAIGG